MSDSLILDPLMLKELRGSTRRWQTYTARVLYAALVGTMVARLAAPLVPRLSELSPSELSDIGHALFPQFVVLQIVFVTLAALAAGSDMITKEVRAGTLGILALTPLSSARIVRAKWIASTLQASGLVLAGVPVIGVCAYMGAVGPWEIVWTTVLTLATAAFASALAVRYSCSSRTAVAAIGRSLCFMACYTVLAIAPAAAGFFLFHGKLEAARTLYASIHPAGFLVSAFSEEPGVEGTFGWVGVTAVLAFLTASVLRSAPLQLRRRIRLPAVADAMEGPGRPQSIVRGGVWEGHPLLWKELATGGGFRLGMAGRAAIAGAAGILVFISWWSAKRQPAAAFLVPGGAFLLLAVARGASLFTGDTENRRWDMLLSAPISSGRLVAARLLGGLLVPESLAVLAAWAFACALWGYFGGLGMTLFVLLLSAPLLSVAYVLSALVSLHSRSLRGAFTTALGIILVLLVAAPLAAGTFDRLPTAGDRLDRDLHPYAHVLTLDRILPAVTIREGLLGLPPFELPVKYALVHAALAALLFLAMVTRARRRLAGGR